MSEKSDGTPILGIVAIVAAMFPGMQIFPRMKGVMTDAAITRQALIGKKLVDTVQRPTQKIIQSIWQGGPQSWLTEPVVFGIDQALAIKIKDAQRSGMLAAMISEMEFDAGQGGGSEPVEIEAILDTMMKLEDSQGGGPSAVRLTQATSFGIHMMVEGYQDSGGGLPETRVVIPGIMHDKQAGSQMFPAMEQDSGAEYFDMKTIWQGSGGGPIEHHILAAAEAIEEPVIKFAA